ncbi:MAG: hypothetical protein NXI13_13915 [Proteobacteria bacterium]|nr:hypothetical protein [Pseudomonadota bacterium]
MNKYTTGPAYVNDMNFAFGLPSGVRRDWLLGVVQECSECAGQGCVPKLTTSENIETEDCPVCGGDGYVRSQK